MRNQQGRHLYVACPIQAQAGEEGKWNDWLFDRGICTPGAKDASGATVQDHKPPGLCLKMQRPSLSLLLEVLALRGPQELTTKCTHKNKLLPPHA